ncbi:glycoside hydrolase superfamily, partial [Stachybotrys elegans]
MAPTTRLSSLVLILFLVSQLLVLAVHAQDCSKTKHCSIGCCSKHGFCGTTSDHCGQGCLSTCDYKPPATECSATKLCAIGCCSKEGFCGTTNAHCGQGCLSTCNYKPPATECSATKLCATGCCSKDGFCGTSDAHCGKGCQSTCDFKLGCDKNNPCKDGTCCSKFGFCGFGPKYCSKENCVAGCDAKTFCDPGGYGPLYSEHSKCPLNVCCSKWGYCGLTEEFCGKKKVTRPSCSVKTSPMKRVVGYYEGWANRRSCDSFSPSNIPDGVYTHINFAFASIDPNTFKIVPAAKQDTELYRQLTRKKQIDRNLKVFIAIGGCAFNDPGPTATTFSDIARSQSNQRVFISSLISFMNTYNFDGVDIDWEYPEAPDRQGRGEDFVNLPKFLNNIKSALRQNGARNGLSIAIPASYWYLQHFDIVKIAKYVDFFNVMTYDLHGSWDTPESWLGNHLNSHTNLTEIRDSLDLLWRNNIDPDQVNLGLAFYSRTFTASNPRCMSPGCLFDSGGPKGSCTNAVGVLSNAEISRKTGSKQSRTELDKKAAVKIFAQGRDWMTYDDEETWKIKLDFARSQCIGGAMVWAISQDT